MKIADNNLSPYPYDVMGTLYSKTTANEVIDNSQRVLSVVLPVISFYRPSDTFIPLVMGSIRTYHTLIGLRAVIYQKNNLKEILLVSLAEGFIDHNCGGC